MHLSGLNLFCNPGYDDDTNFGPGLAIDDELHDLSDPFGAFHIGRSSPDEWLEINMGREETLCKVQLFFQTHKHYSVLSERRTNIEARVGNIPAIDDYIGNPLCDTLASLPSAFQTTLRCSSPLSGMYIVIRQEGNEFWDIDEINAFQYSELINIALCDIDCLGKDLYPLRKRLEIFITGKMFKLIFCLKLE